MIIYFNIKCVVSQIFFHTHVITQPHFSIQFILLLSFFSLTKHRSHLYRASASSATKHGLPRGSGAVPRTRSREPHDEPLQVTPLQKLSNPDNLRGHRRMARLHRLRLQTRQHPIRHNPQRYSLRRASSQRLPHVHRSRYDQNGSALPRLARPPSPAADSNHIRHLPLLGGSPRQR